MVMPKLKAFVGEELIVAHNASFDGRFFQAEMKRARINVKNEFLCTLLLARRIYQNLDSHKLEIICHYLGFINKASHRAIGDAEATHKVLIDICDHVKRRSGKNQLSPQYLATLTKIPKKDVESWLRS
jgi:DNA polymerase-3 subunit epsilon